MKFTCYMSNIIAGSSSVGSALFKPLTALCKPLSGLEKAKSKHCIGFSFQAHVFPNIFAVSVFSLFCSHDFLFSATRGDATDLASPYVSVKRLVGFKTTPSVSGRKLPTFLICSPLLVLMSGHLSSWFVAPLLPLHFHFALSCQQMSIWKVRCTAAHLPSVNATCRFGFLICSEQGTKNAGGYNLILMCIGIPSFAVYQLPISWKRILCLA